VVYTCGLDITLENIFLTVALEAKLVGRPAGILFRMGLKLGGALLSNF